MPDTITKAMLESRVKRISEETRVEHHVEYQNRRYSLVIGSELQGLVDKRVFTALTKREFMDTAAAYIEGYRLPATATTARTNARWAREAEIKRAAPAKRKEYAAWKRRRTYAAKKKARASK